jgi:hypothetical protein
MPKETKEKRLKRWKVELERTKLPPGFEDIIRDRLLNYVGDFTVLESAVGAFMLGHYIGMRPLLVIHNNKTIKKYESILDLKFRDYIRDTTDFSDKSIGYKVALQAADFWAAATGAQRVEGRKQVGIEELEEPAL